MGMHGAIEEKQTLYTSMTNLLNNPKDNLPLYISFAGFFSIIFCIRNLQCLFFVGSWAAYLFLLNSEEPIKINNYEISSNQALIVTFISNFIYLILFQSVV